jgi:signal transduction histidine kinase
MLQKLINFIDRRIELFGGAQYKTFGIFGIINYPLGHIVLQLMGTEESIGARAVATIMCFPLIFTDYWPSSLKKYINIYWILTLLYCLPVFGVYTLFINQSSLDWLLNLSISLFILFLLVDYILLLFIYSVGSLLGAFLYHWIHPEVVLLQDIPPNFIYVYITMLIIGGIFARKKEKLEFDRLETMKLLAGTVAHEMRSPLMALSITSHGLKKHLPGLIDSYVENNSSVLSDTQISFLRQAPTDLDQTCRNAGLFIDILLMNLKEDLRENHSTVCSINQCVNDALSHYPFMRNDLTKIQITVSENFHFIGDPILIRHIFYNLIKNSLFAIKSARKGSINISWTTENKKGILYFRDSGLGISSSQLPHIFERLYSQKKYGTGIGLAFCKLVMKSLGGDIKCSSELGSFTEFELIFPISESN